MREIENSSVEQGNHDVNMGSCEGEGSRESLSSEEDTSSDELLTE